MEYRLEDIETFLAVIETGSVSAGALRLNLAKSVVSERWPFPVPVVQKAGSWHFDTRAGQATPGSSWKKGDTLLIIEAMKMENEILAPRDCTIEEVAVQANQSVKTGDLLLKFS